MRKVPLTRSVLAAVLCVAACVPAGAQSRMVQAADPQGRFTIGFPADWEVGSPASGMPAIMARAPHTGDAFRANVNVVVETLPEPMDPASYAAAGLRLLRSVFHGFTIVDQGSATIAGRQAFYRYYTWEPNNGNVVYQVQAYFTVGLEGFVVTGSTINDQSHIRRDVPVIAQIFETFRPSTKAPVPGE